MNSGWTKVYALMLDDFPIYDGRVGAAMGYLVRRYCMPMRNSAKSRHCCNSGGLAGEALTTVTRQRARCSSRG